MTTNLKTIKNAGFNILKAKSNDNVAFTNVMTNRNRKNFLFLTNVNGEVLFIDGRPYSPIGGVSAFVELLPYLNNEGFEFKKLTSDFITN